MNEKRVISELPVSLAGGVRVIYAEAFQRKHSELGQDGESGRRRKTIRFLLERAFKKGYCRGIETCMIRSGNLKDVSLRWKKATKIENGLFLVWYEVEKNLIMVQDILLHSEIYSYAQA
jgi:hypothetical protein